MCFDSKFAEGTDEVCTRRPTDDNVENDPLNFTTPFPCGVALATRWSNYISCD